MSRELKLAFYIIIDVLLLGLLVMIINFFGGISRKALNDKVEMNSAIVEITEYKNLYEYTRGKIVNKSILMTNTGYSYENVLPYNMVTYSGILNSKNMANFLASENYDIAYNDFEKAIKKYRKNFNDGVQTTFPSGLLSGADIGHFLSAFPQEYNVIIKDSNGKNLLILPRLISINETWYKDPNIFLENPDVWRNYMGETDENIEANKFNCLKYVNNWSLNFLADVIGPKNLDSFYYSFVVYDDFTGIFESVVFMKMEG